MMLSGQFWQLDHGAPVERVLGRQDDAVGRHQPLERVRLAVEQPGVLVQVDAPRAVPEGHQVGQGRLGERVGAVVGPHHAERVVRDDQVVAVARVQLPGEPEHRRVLVLVAEVEQVVLRLVLHHPAAVVAVRVHDGRRAVAHPADDDVGAAQVAAKRQRQAHPSRSHDLELKDE